MPLTAHGEQSALRSHRTPNTAASTASRPAFVTTRTPLVWNETAAVIEVIWVGAEQENFLLWDSTAPTTPNLARRAVDFLRDVTRRERLAHSSPLSVVLTSDIAHAPRNDDYC